MPKALQDPNKIMKNPPHGPPQPGMIFNPQTNRWHKPQAAGRSQSSSQISPKFLQRLTSPRLKALSREVRELLQKEKNVATMNDLSRISRDLRKENERRVVTQTLKKASRLSRRMDAGMVLEGTEVLLKGMSIEAAIPIEQIKGDIARAGFFVKYIHALDPEARRLFFVDGDSNHLFAEYGKDFELQRIGPQRDIAKEYNTVDLEPSDELEAVTTEHEEREYGEGKPGMIPSATPAEKPETDKEYFEEYGQFGEGLGDEGFDPEDRHEGRRDDIKKASAALDRLLR